MRAQRTNQPLSQATLLQNNQTLLDRVGPGNRSDWFQFDLASAQRFTLRSSSEAGIQLRVFRDQNHNGLLEDNEMLKQARFKPRRSQSIEINNAETGTYFIQVNQTQSGSNRYRLTPVADVLTPNPANSIPAIETSTPNPAISTEEDTSFLSRLNPLVDQLIQLTNQFRQQHGLAAVKPNAQLTNVAQSQTQNMALQDFFGHVDRNGLMVDGRVSATSYDWKRVTENLAVGYITPADALQGWIESPGHLSNLLDPKVTEIGIGYYFLADDTGNENWNYYWTQVFAAPQS